MILDEAKMKNSSKANSPCNSMGGGGVNPTLNNITRDMCFSPIPGTPVDSNHCSNQLLHPLDWLAQCQDNVTERDIRLWCCWPDFPMGTAL